MMKQPSKTMIGVFVLGAIGLAVAAILLLGSGDFFRKKYIAICYFEGSVGGLNTGAPVVFRGVKVGSVKDVSIRFDAGKLTFQIPVFIELDPRKGEIIGPRPKKLGENLKAMIDRGLRAQLEMQSIVTGQMQVGLDFFPGKPVKLVGPAGEYPEIPTIPSRFQELARNVERIPITEILMKVQATLEGIEKIINSPEIVQTLQSVSQVAGETKGFVKDLDARIGDLHQQASTLISNLGQTMTEVRSTVQNVNGRVVPLASEVEGTVRDIQATTKEIQSLVQNASLKIEQFGPNIEKTLEATGTTLQGAQATLQTVGFAAGEDSPVINQTIQTLKELSAAARSLRTLADYLERHPEALIRGKQ